MKKMEMQIQFIYKLIDPETGEVKYIGKTKDLKKRFNDHKRLPKNRYKTKLYMWRYDLIRRGIIPKMEVITECDISNVDRLEKFYIALYRSMGVNILNSTDGGDGLQNPSEETRRKIGLKSKGRIHSEETKRKISEIHYNSGISIDCYNDSGEFVNRFINSRRASEDLRISHKNISKTLNGNFHFVSGLTFFYSTESNISEKLKYRLVNKINRGRLFLRVSNDGIMKEYSNIMIASSEINANFRNIWMCLNGDRKTCGGYGWIYSDEYDGEYLKYFKRKNKSMKVLLIRGEEKFIFDSLKIASEETKIYKSTICNYLSGKKLPKDKSVWKYIL